MRPLPVLVPDASVLLKWVLESEREQDRDAALRIRETWLSGQCGIILPALWIFEVGNVLGLKQSNLAVALMRILIAYGFDEEPVAGIYQESFRMMQAYNVTFYDAAYHAVAAKHSGTLITADDSYYRKTFRAGHVTLLKDWQPSNTLAPHERRKP